MGYVRISNFGVAFRNGVLRLALVFVSEDKPPLKVR